MNKIIKIITLSFLLHTVILSQVETRKNPFWLNLSAGYFPEFLNGSISFNKSFNKYSYQIALNSSTRNLLSNYGITTGNIGLGYAKEKTWIISSVYLGPSVSYGEGKRQTYFWGVGVSVNAQVYFMPLYKLIPDVGMGIELYYNYNISQTKDVNFRNVYSIRIGFCITNIHL